MHVHFTDDVSLGVALHLIGLVITILWLARVFLARLQKIEGKQDALLAEMKDGDSGSGGGGGEGAGGGGTGSQSG